jgi:predicted negative regulator of RcsB-dependent stress response
MDEDIAIINQNTRVSLIKKFFKENSKKILSFIFIIIALLLIYFAYDEFEKRKKVNLAATYNSLIFNTDKFSKEEIKNKMIEIINGKVDTYSTLALYYLLDNNLINDQVKVGELFDKVISINKDVELKNLVIFKKGLYFSDKLEESELLKILNPIINSSSIWKSHALYLMAEFFYNKNEKQKSREFFDQILMLEKPNQEIVKEAKKRISRDLSE